MYRLAAAMSVSSTTSREDADCLLALKANRWGGITGWRAWRIIAGNDFTGCLPYGMRFAPGDPGEGELPFCGSIPAGGRIVR